MRETVRCRVAIGESAPSIKHHASMRLRSTHSPEHARLPFDEDEWGEEGGGEDDEANQHQGVLNKWGEGGGGGESG